MAKLKVCEIERFAVADGPGIRTTVFLKGCPLFCAWCANPETQKSHAQLLHLPQKCVGCGRCAAACPNGAVIMVSGRPRVDRQLCAACGSCAGVCPDGAMRIVGKWMDTDDILAVVLRDRAYYERSGGGFTLSGGEALVQLDGAIELCEKAQKAGIHVAMETCADISVDRFEQALGCVDLFLFDVKHTDAQKLAEKTGGRLDRILANLRQIARRSIPCILRVPVVPGFNDNEEVIGGIFDLALENCLAEVHLLPFHPLGAGKYEGLGLSYAYRDTPALSEAVLKPFVELGQKRGLIVVAGG